MRDDKEHPAMPVGYLPLERETLHKFKIPDAAREMRLPLHLEMLRRLKQEFGGDILVMGRIAAPFTSLALVYGIEELMLATIVNPDLVVENVKFFIDHQTAFGKAQLAAGADLIWLGDCCASSMFCSLDCCRKYAFAAAAEVAASLIACGGLVIYHSGDASLNYLAEQVQLPVNAVNVGEGCSLTAVRERVGREMCLMGNFDPILLRDGAPAEIAEAAARMARENLPGGRYLFNTGESVMCNSPAANVSAMLNAVRQVSLETVHDTNIKMSAAVR
jgi:uroporphyrinogen-III decarboxylase